MQGEGPNCIELSNITRIIEMVDDLLVVFSADDLLDLSDGSLLWEGGGFPNEMSQKDR